MSTWIIDRFKRDAKAVGLILAGEPDTSGEYIHTETSIEGSSGSYCFNYVQEDVEWAYMVVCGYRVIFQGHDPDHREAVNFDVDPIHSYPPLDYDPNDMLAGFVEGNSSPFFASPANPEGESQSQSSPNSLSSPYEEAGEDFPVVGEAALPGWIGEFVSSACAHSEADPAAVLGSLLVRLASCVPSDPSKRPYTMIGDTKHIPALFLAIVGDTAVARKGTSQAPVKRLFSHIQDKGISIAPITPGPLSSGEGLINRVKDVSADFINTSAPLNDRRLMVIDEEMAAALTAARREGNILSPVIRSLWDGGSSSPLTKKEPIKCTDAHVCIVTHITEPELKSNIKATDLYNGFANRFLWLLSTRRKIVPDPIGLSTEQLNYFSRKVIQVIQFMESTGDMGRSDSFKSRWDLEYSRLTANGPGSFDAVVARAAPMIVRLSMVYALADQSYVMTEKHLESALSFWEYCEKSSFRLWNKEPQASSLANKIHELLKEHRSLDRTTLSKLLNNKQPKAKLDAAVRELTNRELAKEEIIKTGQRSRQLLLLSEESEKANKQLYQ